jgi:hypothetical protein
MNTNSYLFGLHRSGTNYFSSILDLNFRNFKLLNENKNFAETWKHSIKVPEKMENVPVFIIYKSIYTWLESVIFRRPSDGEHLINSTKEHENILDRNRIVETKNDFLFYNEKISLNLLTNCYKQFIENWVFNFNNKNVFIVKYEDLLIKEKRENILEKIKKKYNWGEYKKYKNEWRNPEKGTVPLSKEYNDDFEKYYLKGDAKQLKEEHFLLINEIIGKQFKERLICERIY